MQRKQNVLLNQRDLIQGGKTRNQKVKEVEVVAIEVAVEAEIKSKEKKDSMMYNVEKQIS